MGRLIKEIGTHKTSDRRRSYNKKHRSTAMLEAKSHYSDGTNICAMSGCNEHRLEFLTLDHINAEPQKWNASQGIHINATGGALAVALRKRNWPEGIQILCMTCNKIKGSHITSSTYTDYSHIDYTGTKICPICKIEQPKNKFDMDNKRKDGLLNHCKNCQAKYNQSHKLKFMQLKGLDKCTCCGEHRIEALSIEHSNNDGNIHRKDIQRRYNLKGTVNGHIFFKYYLKDLQQGIDWAGLTMLCYNCNHAHASFGYCPHEIERGEVILNQYGEPIRKGI